MFRVPCSAGSRAEVKFNSGSDMSQLNTDSYLPILAEVSANGVFLWNQEKMAIPVQLNIVCNIPWLRLSDSG